MCGICGFFQKENKATEAILRSMNDQITHRGPDDEGYHYTGAVGLAARRLSIIDLNTGHQPLPSCSGNSWITYNGEVYNFPQLREDLESRGYKFRTRSDTEVIVNMYEEFGTDFVKHLRGMFAVGIYDKKRDELILARDHIGIKPLYYCFLPRSGNLVFGSEIKAILQYPQIPKDIDHAALDLFLTLEYIPAPHSIFRHIKKLPPGHILTYRSGNPQVRSYWELTGEKRQGNMEEFIEEFHAILKDAVKMRMISDVPLGAFLSGGIDSSAIVATMSGLRNDPIKTFSIGFEEKSYSELPYSQQVSGLFKTDHYTRNLSPDINRLAHHLSGFLDEPLGDFSNFPTYLVSKTAREKVTVVLSGDGGDEIFGGYEHYIAQKISSPLDIIPFRFLHGAIPIITRLFPPSDIKKGFVNRIKRYTEGFASSQTNRHFRWMFFLNRNQKRELYSPDFMEDSFLQQLPERSPFSQHFEKSRMFNGINRDLYLDLKTYLVDNILVKVDRMSMATSLEARVPLLDVKMVEFAFSLPSRMKVNKSSTKWFFKNAMADTLPRSIIHRQKEGFSIPIKSWLKNDLKELMLEYLSEKRIKESGFFNHPSIQKMIDEHLSNRDNHSHRLWALISFEMWKEKFLR